MLSTLLQMTKHIKSLEMIKVRKSQGVAILAYKSDVTPDSIELNGKRCKVIL